MSRSLPKTRFYQVRPKNDLGWARLWITSDGCISVVSDYGNFGYWFGAPGCEFRQFLTQCDDDYLMNKFSAGKREVDGDQTREAVKETILSARRRGSMDKARAGEEWDLMKETDFWDEYSRFRWHEETQISDAFEDIRTRYPSQVFHFMKKMWPLFIAELKAEIAAEAALAHPGFVD